MFLSECFGERFYLNGLMFVGIRSCFETSALILLRSDLFITALFLIPPALMALVPRPRFLVETLVDVTERPVRFF